MKKIIVGVASVLASALLMAKMAKVDGAVIKENTWYTLKNGEFVEWKP